MSERRRNPTAITTRDRKSRGELIRAWRTLSFRGRSNNSTRYAFYMSNIFPWEKSRETGSRGLMEVGALTRLGDLDL